MKQNFIELISVPFNAGESKLFAISGQYFELIDATDPIDVLLSDVNGAQRGVMRSAEASFNLKDTDFATVQLYSATAQTIRFAYGTGEAGTRRAAGAVSIVGTVPVSVTNSLALDAATLANMKRPMAYAVGFKSGTNLAASGTEQVFAAASNVNGAIIHAASWSGLNAGSVVTQSALIAHTSAPGSFAAGDAIMVCKGSAPAGGGIVFYGDLQNPIIVPAGKGLWFYSIAAETSAARFVNYTLL